MSFKNNNVPPTTNLCVTVSQSPLSFATWVPWPLSWSQHFQVLQKFQEFQEVPGGSPLLPLQRCVAAAVAAQDDEVNLETVQRCHWPRAAANQINSWPDLRVAGSVSGQLFSGHPGWDGFVALKHPWWCFIMWVLRGGTGGDCVATLVTRLPAIFPVCLGRPYRQQCSCYLYSYYFYFCCLWYHSQYSCVCSNESYLFE